ncbi:MAG: TMEM165/GDT1 family protein [Candidatus Geothermincolales bacterium]
MEWDALLLSFVSIFVAEFGDKTQLAIFLLASRYGTARVFAGAAMAFTALNALAVGAGALAFRSIPRLPLKIAVSSIFFLLGILSLREALSHKKEEGEFQEEKVKRFGSGKPVLQVFLLVCLMELGDKTQLTLAGLSTRYSQPLLVFLGGTAALWLTSLLGALLGERSGRLLPRKVLKAAAGALFLAFGIVFLVVEF